MYVSSNRFVRRAFIVGGLLAFAAWMATLGIALNFGPRWWRSELEFILTDRHIVMRRGRLRRSIDRREVSYARIHWNPKRPGIGDLEIVRAVPTGALRRRLMLRLQSITAPDRVWAIVRGAEDVAPRLQNELERIRYVDYKPSASFFKPRSLYYLKIEDL